MTAKLNNRNLLHHGRVFDLFSEDITLENGVTTHIDILQHPGAAAIVDSDNDGFVDLAYIGDLGGNIWRIRFCSAPDGSSCATGNWSASLLFAREGGINAVYDVPAVAKDASGNIWVYWGTGDKAEPIVTGGGTDRFFAVKDATLTGAYRLSDLENITSGTYTDNAAKRGWTMNLAGAGEKCLAEPVVFGGQVYFTTYTPGGGGGTPAMRPGSRSSTGCPTSRGRVP